MADVRKRIIFRGRVQGVGFRYTAKYLAQSLGLTGWVRNENQRPLLCYEDICLFQNSSEHFLTCGLSRISAIRLGMVSRPRAIS